MAPVVNRDDLDVINEVTLIYDTLPPGPLKGEGIVYYLTFSSPFRGLGGKGQKLISLLTLCSIQLSYP
jgi:hypothetical protein